MNTYETAVSKEPLLATKCDGLIGSYEEDITYVDNIHNAGEVKTQLCNCNCCCDCNCSCHNADCAAECIVETLCQILCFLCISIICGDCN